MDYPAVIRKLKTKLASLPSETKTVTVIPFDWDDELKLPLGSTGSLKELGEYEITSAARDPES